MTLGLTKRIAGGLLGLMLGTLLALAAPLTYAQTTTDAAPGVPATGLGGESALTLAVLGASALAALAGSVYLMRTRREA